MAFGVERAVSSKEYSSLVVLFIEDFFEWNGLLEDMTLLLMVRAVRQVFLIVARVKEMRLRQDDTPILDLFI